MTLSNAVDGTPWTHRSTPLEEQGALGLRRPPGARRIPVHMLYESGGSAIYEAIERHPDYYPYQTERDLLHEHADALVARIPPGAVLIELGCGDCSKTRILLDALVRRDGWAELIGIDASRDALESTAARFASSPELRFRGIHDGFFDGLARATRICAGRDRVVLFLGSTLGNMSFEDSRIFVRNILEITTAPADGRAVSALFGLDMWKDEGRMRRAYDNDVTALFELNGLRNAIHSLDPRHAFTLEDWRYHVEINGRASQVEMFAVAERPVRFASVEVSRGEQILLEVSHKFRESELLTLFADWEPVRQVGEGYRLALLRAPSAGDANPWRGYGESDLADIDGVARLDYAAFARAFDWTSLGAGPLCVLDVGCGSGAFPRMLPRVSQGGRQLSERIHTYDLLDISANSLRIASENLPFAVDRRYLSPVQDFHRSERFAEATSVGYDLVWSVHGITALRKADLWRALLNLLRCVREGGHLLIVMSDHDSHYAAIDRAYLADQAARGEAVREPFLVAEDVCALLEGLGVPFERVPVRAQHSFPAAEADAWRNFNAWCVYDQGFDVGQPGPHTARTLDACWDQWRGAWRLHLSSTAIVVRRDALTLLRWLAGAVDAGITPLSGEAYARACAAFEERSSQRAEIQRGLLELGVVAQRASTGSLRVLSVGCGDSGQDLAMLAGALPPGWSGQVSYTGVDENPAQRARAASRLAGAALGGAPVQGRLLDGEGLEALGPQETFDLVFLLHVLYYVKDPGALIDAALARLAPGGRLLVWVAPEEQMNQLAGVFWSRTSPHPVRFAEAIEALLESRGLVYQRRRVDAELKLEVDSEREWTLSFLVQADIAGLSPALREELDGLLTRWAGPQRALPHPVLCYVVEPR